MPYVNIINDKNTRILEFLEKENENYPIFLKPEEISVDPYSELGSHPDIVERLWDEINLQLPSDCRSIIYGAPTLSDPESAIILAVAIGTEYAIRVPKASVSELLELGASTMTKWSDGEIMNLNLEFGEDWVFGGWIESEADYIKQFCLNS